MASLGSWSRSAGAGAGAPLKQPNNQVLPVGNSLQTLFNTLAEPANALNDAKTTPETFETGHIDAYLKPSTATH